MYAKTKDEQHDLFQESLYNAWKAFPNFRHDAKFSTWLYKVALNTAMYSQRNNKSASMIVDLEFAMQSISEQHDPDQLNQLYQAINVLNDIEKSIILLYLEELSYKEIGEITGFTENNIGVKLNRIKEKLKKIMTQDGF
jgi:RNA polymerase sigma-70 factor, ECF subfamily